MQILKFWVVLVYQNIKFCRVSVKDKTETETTVVVAVTPIWRGQDSGGTAGEEMVVRLR